MALPLIGLVVAAVLAVPVNPALATQLGATEANVITVNNTDVVSAGVGGMRGIGDSSIELSGVTGTVTQALLYWHGPTNSTDPAVNADVTFDGNPITGTNIGTSDDNCWEMTNSQAYRADVTPYVTGDGTYSLADFLKFDEFENVAADINGVSLVVFFDDGNPLNNKNVTLIDGNDSNFTNDFDPDGWDATIQNVVYTSGTATLELHVGDGQTYGDDAVTLNDGTLVPAGPNFQGDSVPGTPGGPEPGPNPQDGRLWDIKSYDITSFMSPGINDLHLTSGLANDCLSLVAAMVSVDVVAEEASADLSIDKTDASPYGPDPVSSGEPVAYGITVSNGGPDDATGVTVVDTPLTPGATVQSGSGTNWSCDPVSENTLTCHYGPTLGAEQDADPLTVVVAAPTNPGPADTTMTDQATVSGDQSDPNSENNSDSETTTVKGTNSTFSKDHAAGFFDGINTLTIATTRDQTGRFYSSLTVHPDPGLEPGVVSIDEFPSTTPPYNTLCGNQACDAQVQVSGLPVGQAAANNAIEVHFIYVKDTKQGSTIWVKGDSELFGTVVRNCIVKGIANPPKCVNSKHVLQNGDRDIMLLWRDGADPWGGKR